MPNLTINNGGIITNAQIPSIDLRYGPYSSIEEAITRLEGQLVPGLTIGIYDTGGGVIREYQVGSDNTLSPKAVNIDYEDLDNLPKINNVTLTGNKTTSDLGINIPTKTSDLTNDSGFATTTQLNNKQDTLVSGSNIKTINNQSLLGGGDIKIEPHFKGWFDSLTSLQTKYSSPVVGDYGYVKGATTTDPVKIYECTTVGTWSDSGREFNSANDQSFGSGQAVNTVKIKDENGEEDSNATGVLSSEAGVNIGRKAIKLVAWGATGSSEIINVNVGDVVYNRTMRLLRKKISESAFETVPYVDGAVYQYDGNLYVWNGTDLSIVSTTPIEVAKDSRETTAVLLNTGVVQTNSSFTYDVVDKYYTYGGGVFAVSGRSLSSTGTVMVAAYAKDDTFIQSFYPKGSAFEELTKVPVVLPKNTWYIKVHGNTLYNETKLYSLSQVDMNAREEIEALKGDSNYYEPEVCRRRFYKAMEEKCANFMMSGYIIEGPSGYGRYNAPSDEVENPILGHGQAQMPITGMCRLIANSLNYPFLANLWSEKERVIKSENTDFSYTLTRSLDEHYSEQLESEYIILGWKTGTRLGSSAPFYTNLVCAATNYNLQGKILAGYVHLALDPLLEDEETNRCKAMKILFNIGETLLENRAADISSLQTQLLGQSVAHAEVMVYPSYAAFMSNFDASANTDYRLYHYYQDNSPNVNTYSTIKVLATQVVLDYVDDLDEVITITANDIYWAPYSGAIFSAGQQFTIRNLLYAFLMISSNQAGYVLARYVGAKLLDKYGNEGFIPVE